MCVHEQHRRSQSSVLRVRPKTNKPNITVASTSIPPFTTPPTALIYPLKSSCLCRFLGSSQWTLTHPKEARRSPAMDKPCLLTHPELINIHTAFHAGAYQQVLDFDTSSFSSSNALPVRVLKARSQIALGQAQSVSSELASETTPDLVAVKLLADLEQGKDVTSAAKKLAEQHGQENLTVQIIGGIILERAGETEEALALLSKHQGSLDAYVPTCSSLNLADREQGCPYHPDSPPTKPHRSCSKGSSACQEMGTRQLAREHC